MKLIPNPSRKPRRSNFYYSFLLLPKEKRDAIITLYDFCRRTDDIIDNSNSPEEQSVALREWREQLLHSLNGKSKEPRLTDICSVARRFNIPEGLFLELIDGVGMDILKNRYETFEELYPYCYRVASTVGLMSIEIFGYRSPEAKQYAINLGIALQLTNILRDLRIDLASGRVYLPQEDLRSCGYSEGDLLSQKVNLSFQDLIQFECDRARRYFQTARSYLKLDDLRFLYPAEAMACIYERLLAGIEKDPSLLFRQEIRLTSLSRFGIALNTWMRYKFGFHYAD
ncbi:MAG: squalene/phytoene synthase family protein [Bacteroidota bacterium]